MIKVKKFYGDFCAPCKVLTKNLAGKDLEEVNIEENIELASEYRVRQIPTLLFFKDEELVHRKVGVITGEEYDEILNSL